VYLSQPLRLKGEGRCRILLPIRRPVGPKQTKKKKKGIFTNKKITCKHARKRKHKNRKDRDAEHLHDTNVRTLEQKNRDEKKATV